jgi:uncharacterized OsmC-like protein
MATIAEFLASKREKLAQLREKLSSSDSPPIDLKVTTSVAGGSGARVVHAREFTIVTDSAPTLAGYNLGPNSPELFLGALGSCLVHTFLMVATSYNVTYEALDVEVTARIDYRGMLEIGDAPVAIHDMAYEARIVSSASDEQLEHIRQEVDRLCPVMQAIMQPTPIQGRVTRQT